MTEEMEQKIAPAIRTIRGKRVILDTDLALIYGASTKALNQAVKRNADRFPADFMFQLAPGELADSISQPAISNAQHIDSQDDELNRSRIVTGSQKHRDPRFLPYAFTEHGAVMAANVLRSPRAVQMSVFVVRAFVKMRAALNDTQELARKLALLEREVKARLDTHDAAIVDVLRRIMDIIDPPSQPYPEPRRIGFGVKDRRARYRVGRRA